MPQCHTSFVLQLKKMMIQTMVSIKQMRRATKTLQTKESLLARVKTKRKKTNK